MPATNGHPEGFAFARSVVVSTCTGERGTPVPGTSRQGSLRRESGNRARRPSTESLGAHCPLVLKCTPFLFFSHSFNSLVILMRIKNRPCGKISDKLTQRDRI